MQKLSKWLKKYFIPHEHNEFRPHFLRHESMLISIIVILIIEITFLAQVFIVFDKTNFLAAVLPGVLTTLTNEKRAENDVPPLTQNELLNRAAQMKAEDMATNGYFAHTSPDGKTPWYWFEQVGYRYTSAGENLAVNFFESSDVAEAWMDSPSHRENIIKANYKEIGIGIASGVYKGRDTVFVAQLFGTPAIVTAPTIEPAPVPPTLVAVTPEPAPELEPQTLPPAPAPSNLPITLPPTSEPEVTPAETAVVVAPTTIQVLGEESREVKGESVAAPSQIKSFIQKVLTSPREYVTYTFAGIVLLVILALLLIMFIKAERAHPFMVARGIGLMAIIFVLLFVNIRMLHKDTQVPASSLSANAIAY